MTFEEYQNLAWSTATYPNKGSNYIYPALGLGGESGEVLEKIKKIIRDDGGIPTEEKKLLIAKEMGDVLWYLAALSMELGIRMDYVAEINIEKLTDRKKRGVISGSGDLR
jgi:NTP pyrophosphatase (non-canonical NTP hydrolase)